MFVVFPSSVFRVENVRKDPKNITKKTSQTTNTARKGKTNHQYSPKRQNKPPIQPKKTKQINRTNKPMGLICSMLLTKRRQNNKKANERDLKYIARKDRTNQQNHVRDLKYLVHKDKTTDQNKQTNMIDLKLIYYEDKTNQQKKQTYWRDSKCTAHKNKQNQNNPKGKIEIKRTDSLTSRTRFSWFLVLRMFHITKLFSIFLFTKNNSKHDKYKKCLHNQQQNSKSH